MEMPPKLYYCTDGKTVGGPLPPIEIERQIRSNMLPANVLVCEEGHQVWTEFHAWQQAKISVMLCGFSPTTVIVFCVIASAALLFIAAILLLYIIGSLNH